MKTAFINARLLDPATGTDQPGSLLVENGKISGLGDPRPETAADTETVDCTGAILAPGLIDMAVFTGEPGEEHRETLATASRAAAAGGVTGFMAMPNTDPVIDDAALVDFIKRRARDTARVRVYPAAALSRGLEGNIMTEIALLGDAGAVAFTDGDRALADARVMRLAMHYAADCDALIVQHPMEPALNTGVMNEGELATRLGLAGIPAAAETIMIERDLRLVELTGARYHAAQLSTAESVNIIRRAKERGLPVTCGVSASHLVLNETDIGDYRTFLKLSPPLRTEDDRRALAAGVADGTIDVIVSAHRPEDVETKRRPFSQAAFGSVGLETLLAAGLSLAHESAAPLCRVLEALTAAPAGLMRLDSGRLTPGADADLILFDPDAPWQVDADTLVSRSHNAALDGRCLQGRVLQTLVGGKTVFSLNTQGQQATPPS